MGVLTGEEKEKYEQRFIPKLIPPEKAQEIRESKEASGEYEEAKPVTDTIQVDDERDLNSAETFQEKLSKGFRDIFGGHKKSAEEDMEEKEAAQDEEQDEVSTDSEDVTEQAEAPEAETAAAAEPSEEFTDSEEIEAAEVRKLRMSLLKSRKSFPDRKRMRSRWHPVLRTCHPEV